MMKDTLANTSKICRIAQTHTAVNPHWRTVFEVHPEIATRVPASEDGYLTDEADVNFLIAYLSQLTPIVLLNERVVYGEDSTRTASGVHRYFGDMKSYLLEQLSAFYLTGSRNPPSSIALFWLSATVSKLDGYVAYLDSYGVVYETIKTSQSAVFPSQETRDRYKELLVNQCIFSSDTVFNPRNSDPQIIPYYTYNDLAFRFEYKRFNTLSFSMAPAIHFDSLTVPNAEAMLAQLAPIQLLLNPNDPSYYNYIYQEDQRTEHEEIELYGRVRDEVEINFTLTPSADQVLCAGKDAAQFSDTVNMTGFADTGSPVTASFNKLPEAPELGPMDVNMTYYSCFPGIDKVFGSGPVTCANLKPKWRETMENSRVGYGFDPNSNLKPLPHENLRVPKLMVNDNLSNSKFTLNLAGQMSQDILNENEIYLDAKLDRVLFANPGSSQGGSRLRITDINTKVEVKINDAGFGGSVVDAEDEIRLVQVEGGSDKKVLEECHLGVQVWKTKDTIDVKLYRLDSSNGSIDADIVSNHIGNDEAFAMSVWSYAGIKFNFSNVLSTDGTNFPGSALDANGDVEPRNNQALALWARTLVDNQQGGLEKKVLVVMVDGLKPSPGFQPFGDTRLNTRDTHYTSNVIFLGAPGVEGMPTLAHEIGHYIGNMFGDNSRYLSHGGLTDVKYVDNENIMKLNADGDRILYTQAQRVRNGMTTQP